MRASDVQLGKIKREVLWAGVLWFAIGVMLAVGRKSGLYQPTRADGEFWVMFGIFAVLAQFIVECTEVVLTRIQEGVDSGKVDDVGME
ncbi:MAG TPA: hypothetical protein VFO40_01670 [Chthoniobacterales bacterium]|nr:hypothetical protein [Chthoniobacterales bacterium]